MKRAEYIRTLAKIERQLETLNPVATKLGELPRRSLARTIHELRLAIGDAQDARTSMLNGAPRTAVRRGYRKVQGIPPDEAG